MKLSGKWVTIPLVRRVIGMPGHQRSSYNSCMAGELRNQPPGKASWDKAVAACRGTKNPIPKGISRRGVRY